MTPSFYTKDVRCYAFWGYAPQGTALGEANNQLNAFIAAESRGLVLFHDHFVDTPGGFAIFYIDSADAHQALHEGLPGWQVHIHPLVFAQDVDNYFYQTDFTLFAYRGQRMQTLADAYYQSDEFARLNAREEENRA